MDSCSSFPTAWPGAAQTSNFFALGSIVVVVMSTGVGPAHALICYVGFVDFGQNHKLRDLKTEICGNGATDSSSTSFLCAKLMMRSELERQADGTYTAWFSYLHGCIPNPAFRDECRHGTFQGREGQLCTCSTDYCTCKDYRSCPPQLPPPPVDSAAATAVNGNTTTPLRLGCFLTSMLLPFNNF